MKSRRGRRYRGGGTGYWGLGAGENRQTPNWEGNPNSALFSRLQNLRATLGRIPASAGWDGSWMRPQIPRQGGSTPKGVKNEGTSGDVYENKGEYDKMPGKKPALFTKMHESSAD